MTFDHKQALRDWSETKKRAEKQKLSEDKIARLETVELAICEVHDAFHSLGLPRAIVATADDAVVVLNALVKRLKGTR